MAGPLFPANFSRVWVRGTFIDLAGNPRTGSVSLRPSPQVLLDLVPKLIISGLTFTAHLDPATGAFAVQVPATDDPDITPSGWTYGVQEPTGRSYNITVPAATPVLSAPGDPLHGERVIDLIDVVPAPSPQPGTVQLVSGRGLEGAELDGDGFLVLTYSDGDIELVGPIVGGGVVTPDATTTVKGKARLLGGTADAPTVPWSSVTDAPSIPTVPSSLPPTGGAGGVLSGSYPNPAFAVDMVEQAEYDVHLEDDENPHAVTKTQVGLGNVANLAPADLPLSSAATAALAGKVGSSTIATIVKLTQAEYDALAAKDAATFYVVV